MSKIGRYQIESEIGRGAMGVVYLAHDPRLERPVAVKTYAMPEGLSDDQHEEFRERFLREARAAARLTHPGIVTIYDTGEDPDRRLPYIAMEYVPGSNLRDRLAEEGPLEPHRAVDLATTLCEALDVAHAAGIVHRDIKPANILVTGEVPAVKIVDFGVARLAESELTRSGTTFGSPAYMSPEQVRGQVVDRRSDLFSLAVVLYEAISGQRPHEGEDPATVIHAIVYENPIPISRRTPGVPPGLDRFFDRALAKQPDRRFRNGSEFAAALRRSLSDAGTSESEATSVDLPVVPGDRAGSVGHSSSDTPLWHSVRTEDEPPRLARKPLWIAAGAGALVLLLVIWGILGGNDEAYLKLDAKSSVVSGTLSVRVDGDEVYSRDLSAPRKPGKKNPIKKFLDRNHETFEAWIEVRPGKHEIVALVVADEGDGESRDTVVVDLEPGETRRLRVVAGRAFGSALSLKVDDGG